MPIRPEGTSTGKPSAPTAGPTIQLASGENIELSWQERSLCAQTDPEAFFPVMSAKSALNTRSHMMSVLESGVASPSVSAVASSVAPHKRGYLHTFKR